MDRKKRIRVVAVATTGIVSLFIATVGAPLVAMIYFPFFGNSENGNAWEEGFVQFAQVARITNIICAICLVISGFCLLYLLTALAIWFIGPKETPADPK